jgi:uncharacterized protein YlxW (UPF0749 family)
MSGPSPSTELLRRVAVEWSRLRKEVADLTSQNLKLKKNLEDVTRSRDSCALQMEAVTEQLEAKLGFDGDHGIAMHKYVLRLLREKEKRDAYREKMR